MTKKRVWTSKGIKVLYLSLFFSFGIEAILNIIKAVSILDDLLLRSAPELFWSMLSSQQNQGILKKNYKIGFNLTTNRKNHLIALTAYFKLVKIYNSYVL
jgi:hypothetical protein